MKQLKKTMFNTSEEMLVSCCIITLLLLLSVTDCQGALEITGDVQFPKFSDVQSCPGFKLFFTKDFVLSNGTYLSMQTRQFVRGRRWIDKEEKPCFVEEKKGFCTSNVQIIHGSKYEVNIYLNENVGEKRIVANRNLGKLLYGDLFGPMELLPTHIDQTTSKIQWYMPFLDKCRHLKTFRGFHFICNTTDGGSCGNYTKMSLECFDDTLTYTCKTLFKDVVLTCERINHFIPLDGMEAYTSATVENRYTLCEIMLDNLNDTSYMFHARYTFYVDYSNDEDPDCFKDPDCLEEWSDWSNTAHINGGKFPEPAPSTGDGEGIGGLAIAAIIISVLLVVVVVIVAIAVKRRHQGKHGTHEMVAPRAVGDEPSAETLDTKA